MMKNILCVGIKKGEFDFEVSAAITQLSPDEMQRFRAMTVTAIGTMEDMWRRWQENGHPAATENPPNKSVNATADPPQSAQD